MGSQACHNHAAHCPPHCPPHCPQVNKYDVAASGLAVKLDGIEDSPYFTLELPGAESHTFLTENGGESNLQTKLSLHHPHN